MNAQQLKNSILQMAVQGKLVPQNPHDEPASVLVEKIKAEKEKLIKEKKLKPEKNPSFIFKGADNLPYENVGENEPVCIADEVPFDIPDNWDWVRLGEIINITSGKFLPSKSMNSEGNIPVYGGNGINGYHDDFLINGDTLIIGRVGFYCGCVHLSKGKAWVTDNAFITYFSKENIDINFLKWFLIATDLGKDDNATAQPVVSGKKIYPILCPLPPLAEQQRIAEKIEEIMPYIEKYGEKEDKLREINNNISKKLKQSILQEAVQGKLVPQDSNDEPASVLLEKIKAEKAQLIKNGKIKKDKNESYIFKRDNSHYEMLNGIERCIDEEIPFEIPDSWQWVRLGNIIFNHGQMNPQTDFCYIDIGSIDNKRQKLNEKYFVVSAKDAPSRARKIVVEGDILYSTVRPYLHNMCIIDREFPLSPIASTGFAIMACFNGIYNEFLFYYLLSPNFDSYANNTDNAKGVAYPAINDQRLYSALVPVPPLLEQKRIVNKIKELLPFVDKCGKY